MASAAEIANDLRARAKLMAGRHLQGRMLTDDAKSMLRAADMLTSQAKVISELEAAAEAEAQRYEDYFCGNDQ